MVSLAIVAAFLLMIVLSATGLIARDWAREEGVNYAPPTFVGPDAAAAPAGVVPGAPAAPAGAGTPVKYWPVQAGGGTSDNSPVLKRASRSAEQIGNIRVTTQPSAPAPLSAAR